MAYLELSREAYDDLIKAAGSRAGSVSAVCNNQGVWSDEAKSEAPKEDEAVAEALRESKQEDLEEDEILAND